MAQPTIPPFSVRLPADVHARLGAAVTPKISRNAIIVEALRAHFRMAAPSNVKASGAPTIPRPAYGALLDRKAKWRG